MAEESYTETEFRFIDGKAGQVYPYAYGYEIETVKQARAFVRDHPSYEDMRIEARSVTRSFTDWQPLDDSEEEGTS